MGYSPFQPSRQHLLKLLPVSQDELPPRSMQDSFSSAILPLSTDLALQEKYVTFLGNVRLGRLMEDMDIFAGSLSEINVRLHIYFEHMHWLTEIWLTMVIIKSQFVILPFELLNRRSVAQLLTWYFYRSYLFHLVNWTLSIFFFFSLDCQQAFVESKNEGRGYSTSDTGHCSSR